MAIKSKPRQQSIQRRIHLSELLGDRGLWASVACFCLIALASYSNTFGVPFVLDDADSIVDNSTIRDLTNLGEILLPLPRGGTTIDGRPLLNLSVAVNYAVSELDVWSYHALNLAIHLLNACLLHGLLRRIFALPAIPEGIREAARPLAFCIALLWLVHPLQTAAITYVIQRAEAIMAMFYLAAMYCFVRMATAINPRRWMIATVLLCWIGQGAKEIMATAPVALLAMDASFFSGSIRAALRQRPRFYFALASSWLLTIGLMLWTRGRSGTVGYRGSSSTVDYWVAQCGYLFRYLQLSVWPWPQVFDYGANTPRWNGTQWPQVVGLILLIVGILALWRYRPKLAFLGILPMLILGPTSSIPVVTQTAAEHRMYLPLSCVLTVLVISVLAVSARLGFAPRQRRTILLGAAIPVAVFLAVATYQRNLVFETPRRLWEDTLQKRPDNIRAARELARILAKSDQAREAPALYERALAMKTNLPAAYCGRGCAWIAASDLQRATADFHEAIRLDPEFDEAYFQLAVTHSLEGKEEVALKYASEAIRLQPGNGNYYATRADIFAALGRTKEALEDFRRAIDLAPSNAQAHLHLGFLYYRHGETAAAIDTLRRAIYYKADFPDAEFWLASAYLRQGDLNSALNLAQKLTQKNGSATEWELVASIYEAAGDLNSLQHVLANALGKHPQSAALRLRAGRLLAQKGQWEAAVPMLREAAQLDPKSADTKTNLAAALFKTGDLQSAADQVQQALDISPNHPGALKLKSRINLKTNSDGVDSAVDQPP